MALKFLKPETEGATQPANPDQTNSPDNSGPYVKPDQVLSPRDRVLQVVKVLHDGGEKNLSVAILDYMDEDGTHLPEAVAIRWNGGGGNPIGFPSVRQFPVWFLVPEELASTIKFLANEHFQYVLPFSPANAERFMGLCGNQFSTESLAKVLKSRGFKVTLEI